MSPDIYVPIIAAVIVIGLFIYFSVSFKKLHSETEENRRIVDDHPEINPNLWYDPLTDHSATKSRYTAAEWKTVVDERHRRYSVGKYAPEVVAAEKLAQEIKEEDPVIAELNTGEWADLLGDSSDEEDEPSWEDYAGAGAVAKPEVEYDESKLPAINLLDLASYSTVIWLGEIASAYRKRLNYSQYVDDSTIVKNVYRELKSVKASSATTTSPSLPGVTYRVEKNGNVTAWVVKSGKLHEARVDVIL